MAGLLQEKPLYIKTALKANDKDRELDKLNILPYAEALKRFIETCDTPMTVGLQGDWGSGKTSLMNLLRGSNNSETSGLLSNKCLIVNFETWSYAQFNDRKSLPMACLYSLTQRLSEKISQKKDLQKTDTTKVISDAKNKLTSVLKKSLANASVGVMGINIPVGKAVFESDEQETEPDDLSQRMMEFRENFAKLVDVWSGSGEGRRVVICVDDLDRVEPVIALEMLESIKNFLDVDGCVFVLAIDYEVVQAGMAEKLGVDVQKTSGKSFFDKIIQLPFNMPKSSYNIKSYVSELIKEVGFPQVDTIVKHEKNLAFLEEITLASVGGNPRSIKRVLNYARLLNFIRMQNRDREQTFTIQDTLILYSLICMQIAWPELFSHFLSEPTAETIQNLENWEYLERTPELKPLFDRVHDQEKTKNDISTFLDVLFDMLDSDNDGMITDNEFDPVRKVLNMAQFTSVEFKKRPRDSFFETAIANTKKSKDEILEKFLTEIYLKSRLFTSSEIKYRPAGKRYVTLVYKRKQLGSIITLSRRGCIIRLNGQPNQIASAAYDTIGEKNDLNLLIYVRDFEENEGSLTGFGDAILDIHSLMELKNEVALKTFNSIILATQALITKNHYN